LAGRHAPKIREENLDARRAAQPASRRGLQENGRRAAQDPALQPAPDALPAGNDDHGRVVFARIPWETAAHAATVGIFIFMFWAILDLARTILLPVVSAFVIGTMLGPLSAFASRYRVPSWLSATVLMAALIGLVWLAVTLLSAPVIEWIGKAPDIGSTIRDKLEVFERPLATLRELRNAITAKGSGSTIQVDVGPSLLTPVLTVLTPALGELVVFFGTLFFFLLGRDDLRRYLVQIVRDRDARLRVLRILNDIELNLTSYLSVVTVINIAVGCGTAIIAYFAGLPNIAVWAVLAFVLNYIPYLGPLAMNIVLFGVGIVTFPTLGQALVAPACFIVMTTLEGHFITPAIMGRRLTLNPLNVFLALAFWTWLWGPIGAFLAVPLLIGALVIMNHLFPKNDTNLPG
jgi:predicted PurR-regulated permease PerM